MDIFQYNVEDTIAPRSSQTEPGDQTEQKPAEVGGDLCCCGGRVPEDAVMVGGLSCNQCY